MFWLPEEQDLQLARTIQACRNFHWMQTVHVKPSACTLGGLEVAILGSDNFHSLPEVLSQNKMPVTTENLITPEELGRWPYFFLFPVLMLRLIVD